MAEDSLRQLLASQRRRLIASLLGWAEAEIYDDLNEAQQVAFRKQIIDAAGAYHDLMLDILASYRSPNEVLNLEALELLREIREKVSA